MRIRGDEFPPRRYTAIPVRHWRSADVSAQPRSRGVTEKPLVPERCQNADSAAPARGISLVVLAKAGV